VSGNYVFFLDSGAFTLWKRAKGNLARINDRRRVLDAIKAHPKKTRVELAKELNLQYGYVLSLARDEVEERITVESYAEFVNQHSDLFKGGVLNLDEIGMGLSGEKSYENWLELRRLGVDAIPVYHVGEDESLLKRYMEQTDYIGIGGIAKMQTADRFIGLDRIWNEYLKAPNGRPRCRTHALGLTNVAAMSRYPWYSVDSSICAASAVHGGVLLPRLVKNGVVYDRFNPTRLSNQAVAGVAGYSPKRGGTNFYLFTENTKRFLTEYFAGLGFTIDASLLGQTLNPVMPSRQKQRPSTPGQLFDITGRYNRDGDEEEETLVDNPPLTNGHDTRNLSSNWLARFHFNLFVTEQFVKHQWEIGRAVRWFNVSVNSIFDAVDAFETEKTKRVLVSYAYLIGAKGDPTPFLKKIRNSQNGS
jgi:hypothetical protein